MSSGQPTLASWWQQYEPNLPLLIFHLSNRHPDKLHQFIFLWCDNNDSGLRAYPPDLMRFLIMAAWHSLFYLVLLKIFGRSCRCDSSLFDNQKESEYSLRYHPSPCTADSRPKEQHGSGAEKISRRVHVQTCLTLSQPLWWGNEATLQRGDAISFHWLVEEAACGCRRGPFTPPSSCCGPGRR